jgi:hypothetical protein
MFKIIKAKSPSLSDEHFISSIDPQATTKKPTSLHDLQLNKTPKQQLAENNSASIDYDEDYDDNDDAFDKSATLKANGTNTNTSVHIYHNNINNVNGNGSGRVMSDGEASNDKIINRFNSDKSIYYSSVYINGNF